MKPAFDLAAATARRCAAPLLAAVALAWPLLAAADCVDGLRELKSAESEFHRRATAALIASLPPAPAGARIDGKPYDLRNLPGPGAVCREQKEGDFALGFRHTYVLEHAADERRRREAERRALSEQIQALSRLPPEARAQREALEQKASAGFAAVDAARRSGDQARARSLEAEARGWAQQSREIARQHEASVKPQVTELEKRRDAIDVAGQKAVVYVAMNVERLPSGDPGFPLGVHGAASPAKSAGLKVHNVLWSVSGPDTPLREALAGAIDRARLQAMVGKPLPPESESAAFAAGAVPVAVAGANAVPAANAGPGANAVPGDAPAPAAANAPGTGSQVQAPVVPANPGLPDPVRQATDAVKSLRGIFGR